MRDCVFMFTGGGVSHLKESLATMGIPGMTPTTFSSIEEQIYKWWKEIIYRELHTAAAEEKLIAVSRACDHQVCRSFLSFVTGVCSKRSHKHSHYANGGVAIIIGKATEKLLHVGVRNKSCYICTGAESNKKQEPVANTCYKNWILVTNPFNLFNSYQKNQIFIALLVLFIKLRSIHVITLLLMYWTKW